jgi:NADP-reducing hydrogenase subunit HndD
MPVSEGMEVKTNSEPVRAARKGTLELILSDHNQNCLSCVRSNTCELRSLATDLGLDHVEYIPNPNKASIDDLSPSIVRDNSKCILCRRCVAACGDMQQIFAIGVQNRGYRTDIGAEFDKSIADTKCINCGQCIISCPVGALYEKDATKAVWNAIADPNKVVVIQAAPAVRAALGEEFGMPIGTNVTGKMAAAMHRLGIDKVFDTDFAADLCIMEEGTELLHRIKEGGKLPLITSCSPGWIKYCEHNYHDLIDNLSSCKSPHEMFGALIKTYYAKRENIDPKNLFVVSVMPCTAKKFEITREGLSASGYPDVDAVLTTREFGRMIREAGIDFVNLPDEKFDDMLGDYTGAGVIFGATGGVMEAALRTVVEILTGKPAEKIDYEAVRGVEGVKTAELDVAGMKIKVAVAHGAAAAHSLLERVRAGEKFHFIEIMGCPGGCVNGGGQPYVHSSVRMSVDPRVARAKALYSEDKALPIRKSHENASVMKLYKDYYGEPGSHLAHEELHTHYIKR